MPDNRPIGVFDSGVGGLTVLCALHERLPDESTIYLGDLARCPYGTRGADEVRWFALQIGEYLVSLGAKLVVVACNTATAVGLEELSARLPVPVIGVIAPGVQEALRRTQTGRIGVLATEATVASHAYRRALERERAGVVVIERAASWLVPLIERGVLARGAAASRLAPVLSEMAGGEIDTLILGCTHFPLVADLFEVGMGPKVTVVDSVRTTADAVANLIDRLGIQGEGYHRRLLVTGPAAAFAERAQRTFHVSPEIETVELTPDPVG